MLSAAHASLRVVIITVLLAIEAPANSLGGQTPPPKTVEQNPPQPAIYNSTEQFTTQYYQYYRCALSGKQNISTDACKVLAQPSFIQNCTYSKTFKHLASMEFNSPESEVGVQTFSINCRSMQLKGPVARSLASFVGVLWKVRAIMYSRCQESDCLQITHTLW